MKFILGGKGANLAEMANMGLPVPPGFTITCQACMEYYNSTPARLPAGPRRGDRRPYVAELEAKMGKKLGDPSDPLLVSVRSGSPFSMPGMMDTVLNLGLNDVSVQGLIAQTGNERFAWDSYRRFIQMFSKVVLDVEGDLFENAITTMKHDRGVRSDTDLSAEDMQRARRRLQGHRRRARRPPRSSPSSPSTGKVAFPQDPAQQLRLAIEAVFKSWMNRARGRLPQDGEDRRRPRYGRQRAVRWSSATRARPRPPASASRATRPTAPRSTTATSSPTHRARTSSPASASPSRSRSSRRCRASRRRARSSTRSSRRSRPTYRDMCDIEFTIEQGKLWMLQTRVGKRTARAALKIAVDMVDEGLITREEAVSRIDPNQLDQLLHPQFDATADVRRARQGPERLSGRRRRRGRLLGRRRRGGQGRRAARSFSCAGRPPPTTCTAWTPPRASSPRTAARPGTRPSSPAAWASRACAASRSFKIDAENKVARVDGTDVELHEGDIISIDGTTGIVVLGAVALVEPEVTGDFDTILDVGRRVPHDGRARERRHAGRRRARPQVRRRGHRSVPHRAHVPRRAQRHHPATSSSPRTATARASRRSPSCSRPRPATTSASSRRWTGCR